MGGLSINVNLVPEWPEIQAEMRIWKKRREGERKEAGKYTSVVDLAAPEPIDGAH